VDVYVKSGMVRELAYRWLRQRKLEASLQRSLVNLEEFVKELRVSAEY
jgi:hypothetical protein